MGLPGHFHDGAFTWKIVLESLNEERLYGETSHFKSEIRIGSDLSSAQQKKTLFHELIHVATADLLGGEEVTEQQVKIIVSNLFRILHNNPHLVKFLWPGGDDG